MLHLVPPSKEEDEEEKEEEEEEEFLCDATFSASVKFTANKDTFMARAEHNKNRYLWMSPSHFHKEGVSVLRSV